MVFHFLIISGEDEEFVREILIDSKSSFLTFHKAIQESVGYDQGQLASFFLSDDDWGKGQEITLMMMDEESDSLLMDEVHLKDYIEAAKDRLIYTFDFFGNRGFFVEVLDVAPEKNLDKPVVVRTMGDAPEQIVIDAFGDDDMGLFDLEEDEDLFEKGDLEELDLESLGEEW